jgi:hypothetical protein
MLEGLEFFIIRHTHTRTHTRFVAGSIPASSALIRRRNRQAESLKICKTRACTFKVALISLLRPTVSRQLDGCIRCGRQSGRIHVTSRSYSGARHFDRPTSCRARFYLSAFKEETEPDDCHRRWIPNQDPLGRLAARPLVFCVRTWPNKKKAAGMSNLGRCIAASRVEVRT